MEEKEFDNNKEYDFFVDITDEREIYTIKSLNNEKRPEHAQMKVHIKPLSGKDLYEISSYTMQDLRKKNVKSENDEKFIETYQRVSEKWEFVKRIEKLENFIFKIKNKFIEFTDAKELYEYENSKVALVVTEIRAYFANIDRLDLKN